MKDDEDPTVTWQCEELIVYPPVSSNALIAAAIAERWPSDKEQKLVNDYNCANLGLMESDAAYQAIESYKAFLQSRASLKADIEEACLSVGIE